MTFVWQTQRGSSLQNLGSSLFSQSAHDVFAKQVQQWRPRAVEDKQLQTHDHNIMPISNTITQTSRYQILSLKQVDIIKSVSVFLFGSYLFVCQMFEFHKFSPRSL